ncbi:zinc-binding alcohol dehydrogenase family protein [Lentilactobacillus senioris]|uniref:zinc-binding alcohol dehydrogenase family protein n=1 Tax=Lentilactobacillus senioris TaxID=931534 RepID=UPI00228103BB|nr:zinc-binding alcohol dehydrogenase family protein [Lentilactobacillus senioris]MCY9806174.1 zinc-binding alcohol dehydrogenase family protein [Lentilactobacillus senioris]
MTQQKAVLMNANHELVDANIEIPNPEAKDVLVKIQAVAANPVDIKQLETRDGKNAPQILGYDAVGQVVELGSSATKFQVGDQVFYAGAVNRDGSFQEYQVVNEDLVALSPTEITTEQAAAMPLVSLTAAELLFEKLHVIAEANANSSNLLVINGAGGVASVLIPLAKWVGLTVTATASPKKFDYLRQLGVDHPVDYHTDAEVTISDLPDNSFDYIVSLFDITPYWDDVTRLIAPLGHIGTIVQFPNPLDIGQLKNKAASFDWEFMFTKSLFHVDEASQGQILAQIAALVDEHAIDAPQITNYSGLNATNITAMLDQLRTGHTTGKLVLTV